MTLPLADAGGAVFPDNLGPLEIDSLDQQIRESAAELGRKNGPREDTWQPRYEADGPDGDSAARENELDRSIREAWGEVKQRNGLEEAARGSRARPDAFANVLAERSALEAAEWWLKHDPNGAHACLAEYQGIGKYAGIDPAVHGPALLQSFNRAAQYAEVGKQVAAFQIEHRLTNSALRRMTEAINSGACEATLEAAYNHVMSRSSDPTEYEEWLRGRRPGPTHLFGATKQDKPRVARESNPWGFSDRPSKGF